jgi:5'-nucleotidase
VLSRHVFPPHDLCRRRPTREHPCEPGVYEGVAIAPDANVAAIIAPALARAAEIGARPLGVSAASTIHTQYDREAPLGNLLADLLREATPQADVALLNGGGIRADLPAGPITYGHVYEVMPFDNREAIVEMRGASLRALIEDNLSREAGIISISGVRAVARCENGRLVAQLTRENGAPLADDTIVRVVTSDFLVAGGDGLFGGGRVIREVTPDEPRMLRDVFADRLAARAPVIRADDPRVFDPMHPRLAYPGARPVRCDR